VLPQYYEAEDAMRQAEAKGEEPKPYEIRDEEEAAWVMARVRELRAEQAKKKRIAEIQRAQVEQWLEAEARKVAWAEARWVTALEAFARREWEGSDQQARSKGRTVNLPDGKLALRMQQPEWEWEDEAAVLEVLQEAARGDLIRVKREPRRDELKKATVVAEDGKVRLVNPRTGEMEEELPGVRVIERPDPAFKLTLTPEPKGDEA
jgi:phage host-nuclease inhibitor protein Gam